MRSRGSTEQHFYVWEHYCGYLHKLKKVSWYPLIKEGQLSHNIGKCLGTPMFYTTQRDLKITDCFSNFCQVSYSMMKVLEIVVGASQRAIQQCIIYRDNRVETDLLSKNLFCPMSFWSAIGVCDPKPLMTSQSPKKVSIQIVLHQRLQKRK